MRVLNFSMVHVNCLKVVYNKQLIIKLKIRYMQVNTYIAFMLVFVTLAVLRIRRHNGKLNKITSFIG